MILGNKLAESLHGVITDEIFLSGRILLISDLERNEEDFENWLDDVHIISVWLQDLDKRTEAQMAFCEIEVFVEARLVVFLWAFIVTKVIDLLDR